MSDIDVLMKDLADVRTFLTEKIDLGIKPLREEQVRLAQTLTDVQKRFHEWQRSQAARIGNSGRLIVTSGKLAGYDMVGLNLLESVVPKVRSFRGNVPALLQTIQEARGGLRSYLTPESILAMEDNFIRRRMAGFIGRDPTEPRSRFAESAQSWTRAMIANVVKALDSTTAAAGDELVPTLEAAELWMDVNLETLVLPLLPQMAMPSNPFDWPTQFGDTNWYPTTENVQVTTTNPTTAKTTLTAYGLKTGVAFSDELSEDAVIALVPELRSNLVRNAAEVIDDVLLNGDTTVTNGINSDGATISKTTAGKAHWLLGFDGLIHLPLIDNTAQRKDQNAALSAAMFNQGQRRMARFGVPRRRGDVVYVCDINTALTALTLDEVETMEKLGMRATISAGELTSIYANPLIMSEQMKLADTDGKVTDSGNATSTGRILTVNTTQWKVGFKRQIEVETDREPGKSQSTMYVSFRIALTERTGTRSSATHTALEYDVTGVS